MPTLPISWARANCGRSREHVEDPMGRADRTLEQYAVSCGGEDDVASVDSTNKLRAQADGTQEIRAEDVLEAIAIAPRAARRPDETQEIRAVDILEETPAPVAVPIDIAIEVDPR